MNGADDSPPPQAGALARRISHDIRSPLGVIVGVLEGMTSGPNASSASSAQMLGLAARSTKRLDWLARRLQWFAQAQAAGQGAPLDARDSEMPLSAIVRRAVESAEAAAGRRGVAVVVESEGAEDPALGHSGVWTHAVEEVVHNALRHASSRVTVRHGGSSGAALVTVEDDGVGVSEDRAASLFEAFATTSSGFGLWLGAQLLSHCGGRIRHDASLSPGARFVVERSGGAA